MNLDELKSKGGLAPAAPIPKEVTWTRADENGGEISDTFTIHVKRRSFGEIERSVLFDTKDPERSRSAQFISECIFLGDGGIEPISYEIAYQLDPSLATVFMTSIREVNGLGRKEPKN